MSGGILPIHKIAVIEEDEEIGFLLFIPHSKELYEVHTHFELPAFGRTPMICSNIVKQLFDTSPEVENIITKVPVNNKLARRLAIKVGFSSCGNIPNSFKTEDGFIDQEIMRLNRKDLICLS